MFQNFPYTDMHQLNLDWIIKIAKDFLDQYTHIQELIETGINDIDEKTNEGLSALQADYERLEGLLDQWYETHDAELEGTIADALESISQTLSSAITTFSAAADQKGAQVIASLPPDYTELITEITNLQNLLTTSFNAPVLLDDSFYTETDKIIDNTAMNLVDFNGWNSTLYIPIPSLYTVFFGNGFPTTAYNTFVLYDENYTVLYAGHGDFTVSVTDYPTAKYFRSSVDVPLKTYKTYIQTNNYDYLFSIIELFNTNGAIPNAYLSNADEIMAGDGTTVVSFNDFNLSDFIPIISRNVHFYGKYFPTSAYCTFALYDETFTPVFIPFGNQHINLSDYPTAKYIRFGDAANNAFQNYIGSGDKNIVFEIGASSFYTTLKEGISNALKFNNSIVKIHPGVYNLATEFATEISAESGSIGLVVGKGMELFFDSGAYVKALFPSSNAYISTYFQPFSGKNFIVHNLNIEASNCRYCFHDEQASDPEPYHNIFDNCIMEMTAEAASGAVMICPQCIGGGLGEHGIIEIIGGIYKSNGDADGSGEKVTISYHNGSSANCDNRIFIKDVYLGGTFPGRFRFGYYGTSTKKTIVEISGCSMGASIIKRAETQSSVVDNIDITEWNNEIR